MGSTLPEELIASISQQWHCRDLQIRQLINLLCPTLPSPPAIFIHGPQGSGKSSVVRTILEEYGRHAGCGSQPNVSSKDTVRKRKQKGVQDQPGDHSTKALFLSSTIRVAECITARHLLVKIVTSVIAAIQNATWPVFIDGAEKEWLKIIDKVRCEHVSTLPAVLSGILGKTRCEKSLRYVSYLRRDLRPVLCSYKLQACHISISRHILEMRCLLYFQGCCLHL
ncbi:hypothetical protein CIHG_02749 [Coccidioides immitis H538.4]|uniref:Orc1-like AAA ATPase domain-containing protein n=1 Tax=Coccidioides immitis H538.4 TaxID=396776 RepID=A0A0J8RJY0_COCIT|nr:hypothetical protein CIHG_02749 [Coccidioides immitis H538.4]